MRFEYKKTKFRLTKAERIVGIWELEMVGKGGGEQDEKRGDCSWTSDHVSFGVIGGCSLACPCPNGWHRLKHHTRIQPSLHSYIHTAIEQSPTSSPTHPHHHHFIIMDVGEEVPIVETGIHYVRPNTIHTETVAITTGLLLLSTFPSLFSTFPLRSKKPHSSHS